MSHNPTSPRRTIEYRIRSGRPCTLSIEGWRALSEGSRVPSLVLLPPPSFTPILSLHSWGWGDRMPVGTAFHERTMALCESLNYREWSGYYTVGVYEMHHEHEYHAIRNSAALIDISPLFKYRVTGRGATKFVNRVISRDINKVSV